MVSETLDRIREQGEGAAKKSREIRRLSEAASAGDYIRQGDVYIAKLDTLPAGCKPAAKPSAQLAPGNTQGSRHILDSLDGVKVYERANPDPISDGPIIELGKACTVTHPEHIHVELPPGVYAIGYQRTVDAEERQRRAQD